MTTLDPEPSRLVCLVPADVDDTVAASLEDHFAGASVRVVCENRRRDRRVATRRGRGLPAPRDGDRRAVVNPNGRRVDERRRAVVARPRLPVPSSFGPLGERLDFVQPSPNEEKRLAVAESLRLVVRFQLGDSDAFREIYERHFDGVYGYLLTALRDRHDAEDGAQEVFIRALSGLKRYEFRGSPFEAWLFRIVRNYTLNVKHRSPPVSPADPTRIDLWRDERDLHGLMSAADGEKDLFVFVERLPPSQRQVLVLRYMVGLDWLDIATVLDRSTGAVRQLEQRALAYLRNRLAAVERGQASRVQLLPMRRRAGPSPVAASRRGALLHGAGRPDRPSTSATRRPAKSP